MHCKLPNTFFLVLPKEKFKPALYEKRKNVYGKKIRNNSCCIKNVIKKALTY